MLTTGHSVYKKNISCNLHQKVRKMSTTEINSWQWLFDIINLFIIYIRLSMAFYHQYRYCYRAQIGLLQRIGAITYQVIRVLLFNFKIQVYSVWNVFPGVHINMYKCSGKSPLILISNRFWWKMFNMCPTFGEGKGTKSEIFLSCDT